METLTTQNENILNFISLISKEVTNQLLEQFNKKDGTIYNTMEEIICTNLSFKDILDETVSNYITDSGAFNDLVQDLVEEFIAQSTSMTESIQRIVDETVSGYDFSNDIETAIQDLDLESLVNNEVNKSIQDLYLELMIKDGIEKTIINNLTTQSDEFQQIIVPLQEKITILELQVEKLTTALKNIANTLSNLHTTA